MALPGDFEVRNSEVEQKLNEIGSMLRSAMPKGYSATATHERMENPWLWSRVSLSNGGILE
jgi:hypothetical protein